MHKKLPILGLALLAWACSQVPSAGTPDELREAQAPPPTPAKIAVDVSSSEPPDGQWLVDREGREYFIAEFPRKEGYYLWLDAEKTRVRLTYGIPWDLAGYTADKFYLKVYRSDLQAAFAPQRRLASEQEKAAAAKLFESSARPADRLVFRRMDTGLPQRGQWREGFEIADFDGDGKLDIVHGPARKGGSTPAVFLGDGRGVWRHWRELKVEVAGLDYGDVAVADFNQDGRQDLAVASHLRGIVVLVASEGGVFKPWSEGIEYAPPGSGATQPAFSSRALRAFDWNADGRPDLVALGEGPRLVVRGSEEAFQQGSRGFQIFINRGDGSWEMRGEDPPRREYGDDLDIGDFDGDGLTDLLNASAAWDSPTLLARGTASGSWAPERLNGLRTDAIVRTLRMLRGPNGTRLVAAGLSNHLNVWRSFVDVYERQPSGEMAGSTLYAEELQAGVTALGLGDLNADRLVDVVAGLGDGRILVFLADAAGGFLIEQGDDLKGPAPGCSTSHVEVADVDGDGRGEIVASFAGENPSQTGVPEVDLELAKQGCPGGGAIRAWSASPKR